MKTRPILFNGPMVRAILDGTKTQTRRVVKFDKLHTDYGPPNPDKAWVDKSYMKAEFGEVPCLKVPFGNGQNETTHRHFSPHGAPGDRLWVKETFFPRLNNTAAVYRADCDDPGMAAMYGGWKPSIFMPRWLSRITLEITAVRVEKLQDISEEDAMNEGCDGPTHDGFKSYRVQYMELWQSINGPGSWESNPWVWVIQFKRT